MKKYDCHVHLTGNHGTKEQLLQSLKIAGLDGCVLLSHHPEAYLSDFPASAKQKLDTLMEWASVSPEIFPFFWIDPTDADAFEQVEMAVEKGVVGFKCICNHFYPGEDRPMQVWNKIAESKKPILFHSGILYGKGPCSQYNRPAGFEYLIDIPNLRFMLAHVSWPWHDECLALYGKCCHIKSKGLSSAEMFIDITPGTPPIYREEVLRKIFTIGYDIENNVVFGTDCVSQYNPNYARSIMDRDDSIYHTLGLSETVIEKIYSKNLLRFFGAK